MKMIEKMARALCIADGEDPDAFHTKADYAEALRNGWPITDHAIPLWLGYINQAKAALTTLLEPDEGMVEATNGCDHDTYVYEIPSEHKRVAFISAIQHALAEGE